MKKKIIALILILLIVGIFFVVKSRGKTNPNELTLYGNIEIRQVDLSFQVSGLVSKLLKEEGDTVKKGELIAVLDEQDYNANYKRAEAEVERTLANRKDATDKYNRYILTPFEKKENTGLYGSPVFSIYCYHPRVMTVMITCFRLA